MMLQTLNQHSQLRMDASLASIFSDKEEKKQRKKLEMSKQRKSILQTQGSLLLNKFSQSHVSKNKSGVFQNMNRSQVAKFAHTTQSDSLTNKRYTPDIRRLKNEPDEPMQL